MKSLTHNSKLLFVVLLFSFGIVFSQTKELPESVLSQIENYETNAVKNRNAGNENAAATYLNKVAFLYWEYFIYDEAINHFEQVLVINKNSGNKVGVQKVLDNIAFVYSDKGRYDKSIEYFNKSLLLAEEFGSKNKIAECLSNIALSYNNNGQYDEAIEVALKGLDKAKELNDMKLLRSFYGVLYESYDKKGDKEKSVEYFGLYTTIDKHIQKQLYRQQEKRNKQKISSLTTEKNEAVEEKNKTEKVLVRTQDTLKKSQLEIDLLNAENEVKESKLRAKEAQIVAEQRLRNIVILVVLFMLVVIFLIYRQMQHKKQANKKLRELNSEIEKINKQILDSINYASHIQEAILPYRKSMQKELPDSFVLYKPRDIVSGDFYWYSSQGDLVFLAAIDCTGHGVPGAFMSMIGNTLLNEIVNEKGVYSPAQILTQLNERVMFTLNQGSSIAQEESFSEDGMDMSLCCYNKNENTLELALANHTAVLFRASDNKPEMIEGDIYSVGGNVGLSDIVKFTSYKIPVEEEITLYMFSDGYQDQFGGDKNQKFMVSRFINLLTNIQSQPFESHKHLLEQEYENWKGNRKQIDDILVIGIRIRPNIQL